MKSLRCFLILMILGLSSSALKADAIDPKMGVIGGGGTEDWQGSTMLLVDNTTASCEGGLCDITSGAFRISAGSIHNFLFSFDKAQIPPFLPLGGENDAFPIVTPLGEENREALLSGGTIFPLSACPLEFCGENGTQIDNQIFGDFRFVMLGVVEGSTATITSNVPEPGTIILMLSGLGAIGLRRLRRNKVPS